MGRNVPFEVDKLIKECLEIDLLFSLWAEKICEDVSQNPKNDSAYYDEPHMKQIDMFANVYLDIMKVYLDPRRKNGETDIVKKVADNDILETNEVKESEGLNGRDAVYKSRICFINKRLEFIKDQFIVNSQRFMKPENKEANEAMLPIMFFYEMLKSEMNIDTMRKRIENNSEDNENNIEECPNFDPKRICFFDKSIDVVSNNSVSGPKKVLQSVESSEKFIFKEYLLDDSVVKFADFKLSNIYSLNELFESEAKLREGLEIVIRGILLESLLHTEEDSILNLLQIYIAFEVFPQIKDLFAILNNDDVDYKKQYGVPVEVFLLVNKLLMTLLMYTRGKQYICDDEFVKIIEAFVPGFSTDIPTNFWSMKSLMEKRISESEAVRRYINCVSQKSDKYVDEIRDEFFKLYLNYDVMIDMMDANISISELSGKFNKLVKLINELESDDVNSQVDFLLKLIKRF